jgi:hypothetical protein
VVVFGARGIDAAGKVKRVRVLTRTAAGLAAGLNAKATTVAIPKQDKERILVEVQSNKLSAGAQVDAYATNPSVSPDPVFLGAITLEAGPNPHQVIGELDLKNYDGGTLPDGLSPVTGINLFLITEHDNADNVLLSSNPARPPQHGGLKRNIDLVQTKDGVATQTTGTAGTSTGENNRQRFTINIVSKGLHVGDVVEIRFSNSENGENLLAGTFFMQPDGHKRRLKLEFDTVDGPFLPAGAAPVDKITSLTVKRASDGAILLTGVF